MPARGAVLSFKPKCAICLSYGMRKLDIWIVQSPEDDSVNDGENESVGIGRLSLDVE